jgi:hypothetical protein
LISKQSSLEQSKPNLPSTSSTVRHNFYLIIVELALFFWVSQYFFNFIGFFACRIVIVQHHLSVDPPNLKFWIRQFTDMIWHKTSSTAMTCYKFIFIYLDSSLLTFVLGQQSNSTKHIFIHIY